MKRLAFATTLFVLLMIAATGAWADAIPPQVTLGPPPTNAPGATTSIVFTNSGGNRTFNFNTSCGSTPHCIFGGGQLDPLALDGSYTMWIKGGVPTLTPVPGGFGSFTVDMGSATMFMDVKLNGSMGELFAQVILTDLFSGGTPARPSPVATFDGTFMTLSSSGSFTSMFPPTGVGSIDFTVQLGNHRPLGPLAPNVTTSGYLSSGESVAPLVVPEPSSLALLGTGVLGLAALLRRKMIHP
jgi:hypothetical protein